MLHKILEQELHRILALALEHYMRAESGFHKLAEQLVEKQVLHKFLAQVQVFHRLVGLG